MKKIIILLITAFCVSVSSAQDMSRLDSIKNILKYDKIAFEQFRNMGICRSIDTLFSQTNTVCKTKLGKNLVEKNFFTRYYYDLSFQQYLLPNTVAPEKIKAALDQYYAESIDSVITEMRIHDEHFVIYRSPFLIAEQIYNNPTKLYSVYLKLIENDKSYYGSFVMDNDWSAIWRFFPQTLDCSD